MANPKRRHSKSRRDMRKAQWRNTLNVPNIVVCPQCGEAKISHFVCPNCGFYNGEKIIKTRKEKIEEKIKKEK